MSITIPPLSCVCSCTQVLAENSGLDAQEALIKLQEEHERGNAAGLDVTTGEPFQPDMAGVFDNYIVKKQVCVRVVCVHACRRCHVCVCACTCLKAGATWG